MIPVFFCMLLIVMAPSHALAQSDAGSSMVLGLAKSVALDPTTYAPAGLSYESSRMDWTTSYVFFQHGWLERNPRYTRQFVERIAVELKQAVMARAAACRRLRF